MWDFPSDVWGMPGDLPADIQDFTGHDMWDFPTDMWAFPADMLDFPSNVWDFPVDVWDFIAANAWRRN